MKQPTVKLISWTPNPIEYLFVTEKFAKTDGSNPLLVDTGAVSAVRSEVKSVPEGSRLNLDPTNHDLLTEDHERYYYQDLISAGFVKLNGKTAEENWSNYVKEVEDWALKVASMSIPIAEQVVFNFQISNVTIAWREQLVRHRTLSHWIQSGRITDNSTFEERGAYHNPFLEPGKDLVLDFKHPQTHATYEGMKASTVFQDHQRYTQGVYQQLKDAGASDEDIREMLGSGVHHRLTTRFDLRALSQLLKHRTCYIAQGHWVPIVMGIIKELKEKVDPIFEVLGYPPCLNAQKKFTHCHYEAMCEERVEGKDPHPVCPLYHSQYREDKKLPSKNELEEAGRWDADRNRLFGKLWSKKLEV